MRGRATGVVLPALAVLALVAVVAVASTGSIPASSGGTRPPSTTLLDTVFNVWLVALVLGAALFVYGLAQRKAIARELASGKYKRMSLVGWLTLCTVFAAAYWRLRMWAPLRSGAEANDPALPSLQPTPNGAHGQPARYDPTIAWIPVAVILGLIALAVIAYLVSERRPRRAGPSGATLAAQLAAVLDETLDDLRAETDPRRAVIAAYARLERVLAANGVPRRESETASEYLPRVLQELEIDPGAADRLTALFTRAKFSQHEVDAAMKEEAIGALEHVRDELRAIRESPAPQPLAAAGATS